MTYDEGWDRIHGTTELQERKCQKCGALTGGEEAWVNEQIWCHPCADADAMMELDELRPAPHPDGRDLRS
jgi:hypothetical protein